MRMIYDYENSDVLGERITWEFLEKFGLTKEIIDQEIERYKKIVLLYFELGDLRQKRKTKKVKSRIEEITAEIEKAGSIMPSFGLWIPHHLRFIETARKAYNESQLKVDELRYKEPCGTLALFKYFLSDINNLVLLEVYRELNFVDLYTYYDKAMRYNDLEAFIHLISRVESVYNNNKTPIYVSNHSLGSSISDIINAKASRYIYDNTNTLFEDYNRHSEPKLITDLPKIIGAYYGSIDLGITYVDCGVCGKKAVQYQDKVYCVSSECDN